MPMPVFNCAARFMSASNASYGCVVRALVSHKLRI